MTFIQQNKTKQNNSTNVSLRLIVTEHKVKFILFSPRSKSLFNYDNTTRRVSENASNRKTINIQDIAGEHRLREVEIKPDHCFAGPYRGKKE